MISDSEWVWEKLVCLTEEGRRGNGAVAAGDHDADARLDKRHREVDDFRTLLVDGEGADGHVGSSVQDLAEGTQTVKAQRRRCGLHACLRVFSLHLHLQPFNP